MNSNPITLDWWSASGEDINTEIIKKDQAQVEAAKREKKDRELLAELLKKYPQP